MEKKSQDIYNPSNNSICNSISSIPSIKETIKIDKHFINRLNFEDEKCSSLINSKSKIRKWKAGFILIDEINQAILMIKDRKSKLWGFPKGSYEEKRDETMFAFAQRELMEETGLSLNKDE